MFYDFIKHDYSRKYAYEVITVLLPLVILDDLEAYHEIYSKIYPLIPEEERVSSCQ